MYSSSFINAKQLRAAIVYHNFSGCNLRSLEYKFSCFTNLRYLKLIRCAGQMIPDCIGKLTSLRYLDLSKCTSLQYLPRSITKLWNLQTLTLENCEHLQELPTGFSKLVNLRHLKIDGCTSLNDLPIGLGKLKALQKLNVLPVSENNGVDALAGMNLKGRVQIDIWKWRDCSIAEAQRTNLKEKQGLTVLGFYFISKESTPDDATLFLEYLQPPSNLKVLTISGHNGERPPCWMGILLPSLLPNLVEVYISKIAWRFLPIFSELGHLKNLVLDDLSDIEYVESEGNIDSTDSGSSTTYFSSLEYLKLKDMPKLKGWRRVEDDQKHQNLHLLPIFPRLSNLVIEECPGLRLMPVASRLGLLCVERIHVKLLNQLVMTAEKHAVVATYVSELKKLTVFGIDGLDSLSSDFSSLKTLTIEGFDGCIDDEQSIIVDESTATAPPQNHLGTFPKLEYLSIKGFHNLTVLPKFSNDLPELKNLVIEECPELTTLPDSFFNITKLHILKGSPQLGDLLRCLRMLEFLVIEHLSTLTALPESIGDLSQLRILWIGNCPMLTVLPDSFRNLTALQYLTIWASPDLSKRCEKSHGEHWPLIQHIANVQMW